MWYTFYNKYSFIIDRLPVLRHSVDYSFIFFGVIGPIVVSLKMEFYSSPEDVSSVANLIPAYEVFQ